METGVIFCPKGHSALWFLILMIFCVFHATKAEITCRSCQPGNKWHAKELLLKFDMTESSAGLNGEVFGHGDGAGRAATASAESRRRLRCVAGYDKCAQDGAGHAETRLKQNTDILHAKNYSGESQSAKIKDSYVQMSGQQRTSNGAGFTVSTRYKKRTKRNSADDKVRPPGSTQSQDSGDDTSSAAGRRVTRSELRWSGEERRAGGPRQEELILNSSTFALTGDSSHNQAMVHWSGQNSSVQSLSNLE